MLTAQGVQSSTPENQRMPPPPCAIMRAKKTTVENINHLVHMAMQAQALKPHSRGDEHVSVLVVGLRRDAAADDAQHNQA